MSESTYLTDQFLIAMPGLKDPTFFQSVTYICEHNEHGAMGIIINQSVRMTVGQLVNSLGLECDNSAVMLQQIFRGGPVDTDCGFVLHSPVKQWESSITVSEHIELSSSSELVDTLASGHGPDKFIIALGYAGWAAGQLEHELATNTWLNCPADPNIIFNTDPEHRWNAAAKLMGVNFGTLSTQVGHA